MIMIESLVLLSPAREQSGDANLGRRDVGSPRQSRKYRQIPCEKMPSVYYTYFIAQDCVTSHSLTPSILNIFLEPMATQRMPGGATLSAHHSVEHFQGTYPMHRPPVLFTTISCTKRLSERLLEGPINDADIFTHRNSIAFGPMQSPLLDTNPHVHRYSRVAILAALPKMRAPFLCSAPDFLSILHRAQMSFGLPRPC